MTAPSVERRAHPRVAKTRNLVAVAVRARHLAPGTRVPGRLTNLSAGGFAFIPAAPFAPGDLVRITIAFEDGTATTACRFTTTQAWLTDEERRAA